MTQSEWQATRISVGTSLTKKEVFELSHPSGIYDLELFTSHSGECWAIAVPRNDTRFIVYGSPVVEKVQDAIEIVIQKINRENGLDDTVCGIEPEKKLDEDDFERIEDEP